MGNIKYLTVLSIVLTVVFAASETFMPEKSAEANGVYQCQCVDLGDIKQSIGESGAAIKAYQAEMGNLQGQIYTPGARGALQTKVQAAINQVLKGRRGMRSYGGVDNTCDITVEGPTTCLKTATRIHEEVHQQACLKTKTLVLTVIESIRTGKDRFERDNATMTEYAQEEIAGYSAALAYLTGQLARLSATCK